MYLLFDFNCKYTDQNGVTHSYNLSTYTGKNIYCHEHLYKSRVRNNLCIIFSKAIIINRETGKHKTREMWTTINAKCFLFLSMFSLGTSHNFSMDLQTKNKSCSWLSIEQLLAAKLKSNDHVTYLKLNYLKGKPTRCYYTDDTKLFTTTI